MCEVDYRALSVAMQFVGCSERRPYLSGVRIERHERGALLVATNGHVMVVILDETATGIPEDGVCIAASLPIYTEVKDGRAVIYSETTHINHVHGRDILTNRYPDCATYPEWRCALPKPVKRDNTLKHPVCVNSVYMGQITAAVRRYLGKTKTPAMIIGRDTGSQAATLIRFERVPNLLFAIMPIELAADSEFGKLPDWM